MEHSCYFGYWWGNCGQASGAWWESSCTIGLGLSGFSHVCNLLLLPSGKFMLVIVATGGGIVCRRVGHGRIVVGIFLVYE